MFVRFFCLFVSCVLLSPNLLAETYIREYIHEASEADSKLTSRIIALDQVKILLLQEIGTYIRQTIQVSKDSSGNTYASEDVEAITAGVTKVSVLEEKWDGETYYLKTKIETDNQRVLSALEEFKKSSSRESRQQLERLKANERALEKSRNEIVRLRKELEFAKTDVNKNKLLSEYETEIDKLSVREMYSKGFERWESGQYVEAANWFRQAADQGYSTAQINLGAMYFAGKGVKQDYAKAVELARKAADQGDIEGIGFLGAMYFAGKGVKQDYTKAVDLYKKAVEQGDATSLLLLAVMYDNGKGVDRNDVKAFELYRKAVDRGVFGAEIALGSMYNFGEGVDQDYTKAFELYSTGVERGSPGAGVFLGDMYKYGEGVDQNYTKAVNLYRQEVDQGFLSAFYDLGLMYLDGKGVEQDYAKAIELFRKAAEQQHAKAQFVLGVMYLRGDGVKQNDITASHWFRLAAEQGHADAKQYLKKLDDLSSPNKEWMLQTD